MATVIPTPHRNEPKQKQKLSVNLKPDPVYLRPEKPKPSPPMMIDPAVEQARQISDQLQKARKQYEQERIMQALYAPSVDFSKYYNQQVPVSEQDKKISDARAYTEPLAAGVQSFTSGIYSGLEAGANFIDTLLFGKDAKEQGASITQPIHWLYEQDVKGRAMTAQKLQEAQAGRGDWFKYYQTGGEAVGSAVPSAILAIMSGGSSLAAQGTTAGLEATSAAAGLTGTSALANTVRTGITTMTRDPLMWSNFMSSAGQSYESAKQSGASEDRALTTGILSGLLQAGIEVSGGVETLPGVLRGVQGAERRTGAKLAEQWVKSALEEGNEEIAQNVLDGLLQKIISDPNKPLASLTDPNAAINPTQLIQQYAAAVFAGGIVGGGQIGTNAILGQVAQNQTVQDFGAGQTINALGIKNQVIEAGLNAPEDSEANKLASKLFQRAFDGKTVSNNDLGQLFRLMNDEVTQEVQPAAETAPAEGQAAPTTQTNANTYNTALSELTTRTHAKVGDYNVRLNAKSDGTVTATITDTQTQEKTSQNFRSMEEARTFAATFVSQEQIEPDESAPSEFTLQDRVQLAQEMYDEGRTASMIAEDTGLQLQAGGDLVDIATLQKVGEIGRIASTGGENIGDTRRNAGTIQSDTGRTISAPGAESPVDIGRGNRGNVRQIGGTEKPVWDTGLSEAGRSGLVQEISGITSQIQNRPELDDAFDYYYDLYPDADEDTILRQMAEDFYNHESIAPNERAVNWQTALGVDGYNQLYSAFDRIVRQTTGQAQVATQTQAETQNEPQTLADNPQTKWGSEDVTYTNNNDEIRFNYAVVPASSLIMSNDRYGNTNPAYPQELQPRDRSRVASQLQIDQMSRNLNPRRLAGSAEAQNGAPIVRPDGVVISGNGRALAIAAAYQNGGGETYAEYIRRNAERFGITGTIPNDPVLIRVPSENQDWTALARQLNETTTATFSATENAMTDAQKMGDVLDSFIANDAGNINTPANRPFISAFIDRVVPEAERGNMVTSTGMLSANGLERVRNAIFAGAYNDAALSARLSELLDDDSKNVTNALVNTASKALELRNGINNGTLYDLNFADDVAEAAKLYAQVKRGGQTMNEYLAQTALTPEFSPEAEAIAQFMEANKASAKQVTEFINEIYNAVDELGNPNQESLFGGNVDGTKANVLKSAAVEYLRSGDKRKLGFDIEDYTTRSTDSAYARPARPAGGRGQSTIPASRSARSAISSAVPQGSPGNRLGAGSAGAATAPDTGNVTDAGESIGAAQAGFAETPYTQFVGNRPTYPVGENPARIVEVPTTESKTAQTVAEARSIPESFVPHIEKGLMDGLFTIKTVTDKLAIKSADTLIRDIGFERAAQNFVSDARHGLASKKNVALGAQLIVAASNAGEDAKALDLMVDYYKIISTGAQVLQAARILKKLDPNSRLYYIQSTVSAINQQINDKNINKGRNAERNAREAEIQSAGLMTQLEDQARKDAANVPLDEWPFRTGMQLGQRLQNFVRGGNTQAREATMTQLILSDLVHFADLNREQTGRKPTTTEDRIADYVNNEDYYFEAWQAAQEQLYVKYGDDKEALGLYERWLNQNITEAVASSIGRKRAARTPSTPKTLADKIIGMVNTGGFQYDTLRDAMNAYIFGADSDISIDPILAERYRKAATEGERDTILDEIYKDLGSQVPATLADKWNAWRYLSMLGTFKTHFRNTLGNSTFLLPKSIKNMTATALESIFISDPAQRTKSFLNPRSEKDRAYAKNAWDDFQNVMDTIMEPGKYETAKSKIEENMTIFRTKWLEALRKFNSNALNVEDTWFSQPAYSRALARYMKAQGMNPILSENTTEQLDAAREYAVKEAQKATYRDRNAFSDFVTNIGKKLGGNRNILVESLLPFKRTPANILVRGFEYSPAGLAKTIFYDSWSLARGNITAAEYIDRFSAGLTGTLLLGSGVLLRALGILTSAPPDDDDENDMNKLTGRQNYALNVFGYSIPINMLAPAVLPVFVGAELHDMFTSEHGTTLEEILSSITSLTDPIIETTMLDGIQTALDSVTYADNRFTSIIANTLIGYITQGIPTILGQAEGVFEPQRTQTYIDRTSGVPAELQYILGKVFEKIPGIDYNQTPYVDAFGRTTDYGNIAARAFNNLINPFFINKIQETAVDRKIAELNANDYLASVPNAPANNFSYKNKQYDMSAAEYTQFEKTRGQTMYTQMENLMNSPAFENLSPEEQGKAFADIMEFAGDEAKRQLITSRGDKYSSDWDDETNYSDLGTALAYKESFDQMIDAVNEAKDNNRPYAGEDSEAFVALNDMYNSLTRSQRDDIEDIMKNKGFGDVMAALDANITPEEFYEARGIYQDLNDDESLTASQKAEQFAYRLDVNIPQLNDGQKTVLRDNLNFFQIIPQEAKRYEALTTSGIPGNKAIEIYNRMANLTGTGAEGKPTTAEKRQAIANLGGITNEEKLAVIKSYFPPSDTDTTYKKYATAFKNYGVNVIDATYYFNQADQNGNGSISEAEAKATLNSMNLNNQQRGVLFALTSKTFTKAGGNPYGGPLYGGISWAG